VLASLFVSLTIVPFLSSRILSGHETSGRQFLFERVEKIYQRVLPPPASCCHCQARCYAADRIWLSSWAAGADTRRGVQCLSRSEKPMFLVNIQTPLGTSLPATDTVARYVEREISPIPDLKNYATNVGPGYPRIYYNVIPQNEVSNYAQLFIQTE